MNTTDPANGAVPTAPAAAAAGFAVPIQVVAGTGAAAGVSAWLAEDHSVPVVSISWGWSGGAALDPDGQEGAASMAAALLTEGAGDLPAARFQDTLRDAAISLSFNADRDGFEGGLRALRAPPNGPGADALPEAVRLARSAMTAPRFDPEAVERVRARAVAGARQQLEGPRGQASRAFWAAAFPGSPYGRPPGGTAESLAALPVEAIRATATRQLVRAGGTDGLLVTASGAISAAELGPLLEQLFGALPGAAAAPAAPPLPAFALRGNSVVEVDAPQCTVIFGQPGPRAADPDWEAAGVAMRVLAGGGFSSRLMNAVRVERGLSYGIGAGFDVVAGQGLVIGSVATENARVAETLSVLRAEWARMAAEGPTEEEMADAIAYLSGSLPLQFTDSRRTASILLGLRRNDRPLDWLSGRPARLASLGRERVAAVARRLLNADALGAAVAGKPVGL